MKPLATYSVMSDVDSQLDMNQVAVKQSKIIELLKEQLKIYEYLLPQSKLGEKDYVTLESFKSEVERLQSQLLSKPSGNSMNGEVLGSMVNELQSEKTDMFKDDSLIQRLDRELDDDYESYQKSFTNANNDIKDRNSNAQNAQDEDVEILTQSKTSSQNFQLHADDQHSSIERKVYNIPDTYEDSGDEYIPEPHLSDDPYNEEEDKYDSSFIDDSELVEAAVEQDQLYVPGDTGVYDKIDESHNFQSRRQSMISIPSQLISDSEPEADEISVVKDVRHSPMHDIEVISSDAETEIHEILETTPVSSQATPPIPAKRYPWTQDVDRVLKTVFQLKSFRQNQLEAINATLSGKDVFLLMPTGGGKSLCYQLPALVDTGFRTGGTIVISPLISLMQDQVSQLRNKGISAEMISSSISSIERKSILKRFKDGQLRLLYISPEMLSKNKTMKKMLVKMGETKELARFVIDEAHCVSSWGHDFRPDYKLLQNAKSDFPHVPIMALTATANEKVRMDIFKCLRDNTIFLKQSFNRPNLFYRVQEKSSDSQALEEIKTLLNGKFKGQSGIIYCHSRASCERTAEQLHTFGLRVLFYHGQMNNEERTRAQNAWQQGRIQAICATTAFGMGIDKPNVRFVIHLTISRNMEGYYQETGRAGRDGLQSECIMFYHYKDMLTMQSIIGRDDIPEFMKTNQKDMLKQVVLFCGNTTECRRKQILSYFNEIFDVKLCRNQCDNCQQGLSNEKEPRDVTEITKNIIKLVQIFFNTNVTISQCVDVYRGMKNKKLTEKNFHLNQYYGIGKGEDKNDTERIFYHLVSEGILEEYSVYHSLYASSYIRVSQREANKVLNGQSKVIMMLEKKKQNKSNKEDDTVGGSTQKRRRKSSQRTLTGGVITPEKVSNTFEEVCYGHLELRRLQLKNQFNLSSITNVISDVTLRDMATQLPTDLEGFSLLKDITESQIEQFYGSFREILVGLKKEQQNSDNSNKKVPKKRGAPTNSTPLKKRTKNAS